MALTNHESDFISRLQQIASDMLELRARIEYELALYNGDGFGLSITDSDLQSKETFAHLTQSKMWNTIAAAQDIYVALGPLDSGIALDFVKFKG